MSERAIIYFSELHSETEEFIEVVIENFPVVPPETNITIKDADGILFEAEVSFYVVTNNGLEVDAGDVTSKFFQKMLPRCSRTERPERYRYPDTFTLGQH